MSFVCIDLGASGSRYVSESGKISVLPNNMVILKDMAQSSINPDDSEIESCLEVKIEKTSGNKCEHFPVNALIGIMAERYSSFNLRPSILEHKHNQRINYISSIVCAAISKIKFNIGDDIELYLAVPPIEIQEARKKFEEQLVGTYKVTFPKYAGGTEVTLNIVSVNCNEESFMAVTSFFFNMKGQPREEALKFFNWTVLSLDIGASTSDLAVIKNGRYLDKSGRTYKTGGNEARDYLVNEVSHRYSMDLNIEDAEKVIAEGRLQQGNSYIDVSSIVAEAKSVLANKLAANMQTYFKAINIDIKTVNAIIVSGGGSMQSQYVNDNAEVIKTSEPLSYFVTQSLIEISPNTDVVPYGDDARLANIKGSFIKACLDHMNKTA